MLVLLLVRDPLLLMVLMIVVAGPERAGQTCPLTGRLPVSSLPKACPSAPFAKTCPSAPSAEWFLVCATTRARYPKTCKNLTFYVNKVNGKSLMDIPIWGLKCVPNIIWSGVNEFCPSEGVWHVSCVCHVACVSCCVVCLSRVSCVC